MTTPLIPTKELIENKQVSESRHYDFKRELDLDKKHPNGSKSGKERFLDDVVAFLNGGHGHIVIGVVEVDGVWQSYQPLSGDREKLCNRIQMVIHDNIKPAPTKIEVVPIDLDNGFIIDVRIPDHWKKPYQNSISGAFYTRSGARNRVLSVGEIQELFAENERMEADLAKIYTEFDHGLSLQDAISNSRLSVLSVYPSRDKQAISSPPRLQFGILPRQRYDRDRHSYNPRKMGSRQSLFSFDGGPIPSLKGCSEGFETVSMHERLFLGTDWSVLGHVDHPLDLRLGRPNVEAFAQKLSRYLGSIGDFLAEEGISGPFAIIMGIEHLDELDGWSRPGMATSVSGGRPRIVGHLNDETALEAFIEQVRSALYG